MCPIGIDWKQARTHTTTWLNPPHSLAVNGMAQFSLYQESHFFERYFK